MSGGPDPRGLPPGYEFRPQWEMTARDARDRLRAGGGFMLVDVRTDEEVRFAGVPGSVHIPLHELESRLDELDPEGEIAFLCHHGVRSLKAAALARTHGIARAVSVAGGIDLWSLSVDPGIARYRRTADGRPVPA